MYSYEIIGFVALIFFLWAYLPMAIRQIRSKYVSSISNGKLSLICLACLLGIIYGVANSVIALVILCVIAFTCNALLLGIKVKHKNLTP